MGQVAVEDKSNEIVAIPKLLSLLDLKGCIVTIDAGGCYPKIASGIVDKKADFVFRNYYRQYRPKEWLFEGLNGHAKESVPQKACNRAEELSGIGKKVTPHVLRHSFATALLEQNVDLVTISNLLGHSRIKTTELYTHVTLKKIQQTPKPLDML